MKYALIAGALLASFPVALQAATTSDSDTFTSISIGAPSFTIMLDKFDPLLGQITKVTLTLNVNTSGSTMSFDNEAGSSGTVTLGVGTSVTATPDYLSQLTLNAAQSGGPTAVAADNDGAPDFVGTDSFTISGGIGSGSDNDMSTLASILSSFVAQISPPDPQFATVISNSIFTSTSTSGIFGPISTSPGTFSGDLTVVYEYTPTPEPTSTLLLGSAGALMAFRRRRS